MTLCRIVVSCRVCNPHSLFVLDIQYCWKPRKSNRFQSAVQSNEGSSLDPEELHRNHGMLLGSPEVVLMLCDVCNVFDVCAKDPMKGRQAGTVVLTCLLYHALHLLSCPRRKKA